MVGGADSFVSTGTLMAVAVAGIARPSGKPFAESYPWTMSTQDDEMICIFLDICITSRQATLRQLDGQLLN